MEEQGIDATQEQTDWAQRLENIGSAVLEILRGVWDVQQSSYVLLSLLFYRRLVSLVEEADIDFLEIEPKALEQLQQQRALSISDPREILLVFEWILTQLMQQNRALSKVFEPLHQHLNTEASDSIWQAVQLLHEVDLSLRQFSVASFGQFFFTSLYKVATRAGKSGNDSITPPSINLLLTRLSQPRRGEVIYDPSAGQGNTFVEFQQFCKELRFIGEEIDPNTWALCQMNLWANGIYDADILCQDALQDCVADFPPADIGIGHFPFGLTVDSLQVRQARYLQTAFLQQTASPVIDGNSLFVQRILHQIHENGRAFVVLPLQVAYKDRFDKRLREFLLRRDLVEAVISLPAGMLYATGAPICIWVIRKKKARVRQHKILFINASNAETQQKSKLYKSLSAEQIEQIAQAYRMGEGGDFLQDNVLFVANTEIINNQYNLNPKQYASPFIQQLRQMRQQRQILPLNKLLSTEMPFVWFDRREHMSKALPLARNTDLGASFAEYQLLTETLTLWSPNSQQQDIDARLLTDSAILVNTEGRGLRLSYFEYRGEPILVGSDVQIFGLRTEVDLNLEYLFLQLHSDLLQQQINLYKSDHYQDSSLSEREFANLQIALPDRLSQDGIVRETKIRLLRAEEQKVDALRQRLNMDKQRAQSEQNRIFSSLQHELGNRLPAILTEFKNLKDYILDKVDSQEPLQLDDPLFPPMYDEDNQIYAMDNAEKDTLQLSMQRVELLLRHVLSTLDATSSIIKADKTLLQLRRVDMKKFLQQIANLYALEPKFSVQIEVEEDGDGNELSIYTQIDQTQLTTAIVNLIENAKRHGFVEDKKYLICFRLAVSLDRQEVIIEYRNDGKPFPPTFSFSDFIAYGSHAGETGHSGIGGYLIYQIIENHEGTLTYRDSIERDDPFKVQFEITIPLK